MDRSDENEQRFEAVGDADTRAAFPLPRPNRTLTALATGALALPGIAGSARADAPIERATASSAFSYYREDQIPQKRLAAGSENERYEIFAKQLRFDIPTSERTDIGIDILYEEMSGASPWYVTAEGGRRVQVMSGATIEEERTDVRVDLDYYMETGKDTISLGYSVERDYESWSIGLATERNFNDKNTTFNLALGANFDEIEPTRDGFSSRIVSDQKWAITAFAGLSQVLSRASIAQVTVNFKHSDGFLDDPYKLVAPIGGGANVSDARPHDRDQVTILTRYRHHFEDIEGSLHVDYQFHADTWGIISHAADLGWYQRLADIFTIAPSFRYYSQSKADFYEPLLNGIVVPIERSADYRLSPFGAVSARIKFEVEFEDVLSYDAEGWSERFGLSDGLDLLLSVAYERYISDGDIGLTSVGEFDQNPGLVNFQIISFSLNGRF
ncbi:MAG: DUF3570 domain-containing protein [bacterium]|nr:DUF3570 domain-containing protein [bacterium]